MGVNKKLSAFNEVGTATAGHFFEITKEDVAPKLNQKISKDNLFLQLGVTAWTNAGLFDYTTFQAGATVGGDPMKKEISLATIPAGTSPVAVLLINTIDLDGPGLDEENVEMFNDKPDFIAGNLLDEWDSGAPNKTKITQFSYTDKSGKILTTGIVLKLRLTCDIDIANLTAGEFRLYYKVDKVF